MSRQHVIRFCLFVSLLCGGLTNQPNCLAQNGTLAEPFPASGSNAALDYQRAIIHLANVDDTQVLSKPIWEVLPSVPEKQLPASIERLLTKGRFAVQSAAAGTRAHHCDFGIDFRQGGAAVQLPHVEPLVKIGRLLTLRGALAQSRGDWQGAMIIYFDGLRLGRHLNQQNTLIESLAGIEILRNNYYALASWACHCPSRPLVARAFGLFESLQSTLVQPAQVITRESSILALEIERLALNYPDGPWAYQLLDSCGIEPSGDPKLDAKKAIEVCTQKGVPSETFESVKNFRAYLAKIRSSSNRLTEAIGACVSLPAKVRVQRAIALKQKYKSLLKVLDDDTSVDPVEVSVFLGEHDAERAILRLALAVAASKDEGKYPESIKEVADRFGGSTPQDPYRGGDIGFHRSEDGSSFELTVDSLGKLPRVHFASVPPSRPTP